MGYFYSYYYFQINSLRCCKSLAQTQALNFQTCCRIHPFVSTRLVINGGNLSKLRDNLLKRYWLITAYSVILFIKTHRQAPVEDPWTKVLTGRRIGSVSPLLPHLTDTWGRLTGLNMMAYISFAALKVLNTTLKWDYKLSKILYEFLD